MEHLIYKGQHAGVVGVAATLKAGCKINISLRITGRRPDGQHILDTTFYPLDKPYDVLTVLPAFPDSGLVFHCTIPDLDTENNLVVRAYRAFVAATDFAPDLDLTLEKHIPVGAGLGGGSSDAACLLRYLNGLVSDRALSAAVLRQLAVDLGADVPFFLMGIPARASGIGDILVPEPISLRGLYLVLACPRIQVATAWAYRAWDELIDDGIIDSLTYYSAVDNIQNFSDTLNLYNSFEKVVFLAYPALRRLKEQALAAGAAAALLSGSGSSVFGLFRQHWQAVTWANQLLRAETKVFLCSCWP
ncbi:4-diphosphocytidyl-2-C-methyl-D-erythritol kinase [Desulfovibrionales bacterium]